MARCLLWMTQFRTSIKIKIGERSNPGPEPRGWSMLLTSEAAPPPCSSLCRSTLTALVAPVRGVRPAYTKGHNTDSCRDGTAAR